ncbi:MAG: hypothetical protein IPJ28_14685 [Betaproteobacteria bacterium]|nr:hypothetical protein [Betaproteobacteria bacterium]
MRAKRFRTFLVAGLLAAAPLVASSAGFTWSTLAGTPGAVVRSIDATGAAAQFYAPRGIARGSGGVAYVADASNSTIRLVTSAGVVTTYAGTAGNQGGIDGTGAAARFTDPYGVAVDPNGNVYVADTAGNRIRKIAPGGIVTTFAGSATAGTADGTGTAARFDEPRGVATDVDGNVYVADYQNHAIRKITPAGVVTTLAGTTGTGGNADGTGTAARFREPQGVAVDSSGNVYVADSSNHTIRLITPGGVVTTLAGIAGFSGNTNGAAIGLARFREPRGVAVDGSGNVYVADYGNHAIRKISGGTVSTLAGSAGVPGIADGTGSVARFFYPSSVSSDAGGNLLVADTASNTIRAIDTAGAVTTLAGLAGRSSAVDGTGSAARFEDPYTVASDGSGNLYVADAADHTVRKITPAGVVTTLAGTQGSFGSADGTGAAARFFAPFGIAADSAGTVYLADSGNHTVRKITAAGVVTTIAGTAGLSGATNGTGAAARFSGLYGLAVDTGGNVYAVDGETIRKITPAGVVTTLAGTLGAPGFVDATGTAARFLVPFDVTVDSAGNLYVCDHGNHAIRKITPAGVVTTLAGSGLAGNADGTGTAATFRFPSGVAVDATGTVHVADTDNQTIRSVTAAGVVTTVGGAARSVGSTDGVGTASRFFNPKDVTVDTSGNLYVADRSNFAIRKGTLSTNPARLANISTRMQVLTGNDVMIGGFIIGGTQSKTVVVRARGPSLTAAGVPGALANPVLLLYSGATPLATNDNWQDATNAAAVQASGFAPSNALEAAIHTTLAPGAYTAIVTGTAGGTGVGIVEVFEVDLPDAPLINISTRGQVLTGNDVMIGGFIIQGDTPQTVVVRARGPSLTAAGVPGALANPVLLLYSGATPVASNDDWQVQTVAGDAAAIQASGFAPSNALESAIRVTLAPGAYTAIVTGAGSTTGVGIIEVFAQP